MIIWCQPLKQLRDFVLDATQVVRMRRHKLSVTCIAASADGQFIFSGAKVNCLSILSSL